MFFFRRKNQPDDPPNVRLMKSMKFSSKEIIANRSGTLTDAQRRKIRRNQLWSALALWIGALTTAVPAAMLLTRAQGNPVHPAFWLLLLMSLFFIMGAFWEQSKTRRVLLDNRTASVTGPLTRRVDMVYTGKVFIPIHKVIVDEKAFVVGQPAYDAFIENEVYTIYHLPNSESILSAELTHDEKAKRLTDEAADVSQDDAIEDETMQQRLTTQP